MKFEFMPRYTQYLCWYKTEIRKDRSTGFLGLFLLTVVIIGALMVRGCATEEPKPQPVCHVTDQEKHLADFFMRHGSPQPLEMALAVAKTKNPKLMAAVAVRESNGNPKAVGDGGASKGAWQVQEKHWAKVPTTATEQALQAEKILEELVASSQGRLQSGLEKYNTGRVGTKAGKRYATDVLRLKRRLG